MTTESYVEKPKTLSELREGIASGRLKATDLATSYYERIEQVNPQLNVYLSLTKKRALAQAAQVDAAAAKGDPLGPLAGIPVGIKDVLVMRGAPATAGSKILKGYHPPYDATAGREARGGRSRASGQAQLRRVCHGLFERELGLRPGAQSSRH